MKRIPKEKQKEIMIETLKYFDDICRKNNIYYSLIGGTLIGAIRNKGLIPWDDDIDIILDKENYNRVVELLKNDNNPNYKLLTKEKYKDYFFPFPKLVATNTFVVEPLCLKQCQEYGIFIDILCYNNMPKNKNIFKKLQLLNSLLSRKKLNFKKENFKQNVFRLNKNIISFLIGYNNLLRIKNRIESKYDNTKTEYVLSNWPVYSYEKEYQLSKNIKEYIDVPFENINVMVFKNYDEILKTIFGDYMQEPPINERKTHHIVAYWRK